MKNVTISMKDDLVQFTRVEAAKAGKSMSHFIADLIEKQRAESSEQSEQRKQERLEALRRIFDGPMWDVTENGKMPNADERNARR